MDGGAGGLGSSGSALSVAPMLRTVVEFADAADEGRSREAASNGGRELTR